uniref:Secreted protein n=1 Tax=Romanomermis culicivorax TaxID=13658 RepID=A0A915I4Z4_ROMCU
MPFVLRISAPKLAIPGLSIFWITIGHLILARGISPRSFVDPLDVEATSMSSITTKAEGHFTPRATPRVMTASPLNRNVGDVARRLKT